MNMIPKKRNISTHNPFSMPQGIRSIKYKEADEILAYQYDIVCNGVELSSGAVRNHDLDIMVKYLKLQDIQKKILRISLELYIMHSVWCTTTLQVWHRV